MELVDLVSFCKVVKAIKTKNYFMSDDFERMNISYEDSSEKNIWYIENCDYYDRNYVLRFYKDLFKFIHFVCKKHTTFIDPNKISEKLHVVYGDESKEFWLELILKSARFYFVFEPEKEKSENSFGFSYMSDDGDCFLSYCSRMNESKENTDIFFSLFISIASFFETQEYIEEFLEKEDDSNEEN